MAGVATQIFTALHIQLSSGLTELHFEIFTVLALLSWYRDWKLFISSVGFIAVHHVLFFVLQSQGSEFTVFEEGHMLFSILVVHAFFAVVEGSVLALMTKANSQESVNGLKLKQTVDAMLAQPGMVDLEAGCNADANRETSFGQMIWAFRQGKRVSIIQ